MTSRLVAALISSALLAPAASALAQSASAPTDFKTEITRKRYVVRPLIDPAIVAKDAEEAKVTIDRPQPKEEIARDMNPAQMRRPDLDYDVRQAIQQRNIGNALRGR